MKKKLGITVLMDAGCIPADDPEFAKTTPPLTTTEYHVVHALRNLGHPVSILGVHERVDTIVAPLLENRPDLIFNLTECFRGNRRLDKNIAGLLELLDMPYTGTGPAGLMLCRHKGLCKQLLSLHKIRVPGFATLEPGRAVRISKALRYPVVVKPAYEDGSVGISNLSLVRNEAGLLERVRMVHERLNQPAVVEEYVEGRELYVSLLGNKRLTVLPPRELFLGGDEQNGPVLATYRVKWDQKYQEKWNIRFGMAELDEAVMAGIARICKKVYRVMQLQDYGRIDLRLTPENKLVILEVNPNPDIAYGEEVAEAAERADLSYNGLIERILSLALRRCGDGPGG